VNGWFPPRRRHPSADLFREVLGLKENPIQCLGGIAGSSLNRAEDIVFLAVEKRGLTVFVEER
jgi:hypothetical protein